MKIEVDEYDVFEKIPLRTIHRWMEENNSISPFMVIALRSDLKLLGNDEYDKELRAAIKTLLEWMTPK